MEPVDRFRLIAAVALADRKLDQAECVVLDRAAKGMGLGRAEANQILQALSQGGTLAGLTPPTDRGERSGLFRQLLDVVLADGEVTPAELQFLQTLAPSFGVNAWDVPSLLENAQALVGVSKAPAPGPDAVHQDWTDPQRPSPPRAKTGEAACPSCGAPVAFRNTSSTARVCEYCDTTVVRTDQAHVLEELGKVSQLVPDASPIQLGSSGKCFGVEFDVIGRLQIEHETGNWNEWFLEWADGKSGWLGEALGQYFVTFPGKDAKPEAVPAYADLRPGHRLFLGKKRYVVTEVRLAKATGTEGETPFAIGAGYVLPYADLRRASEGFATIDYSEDPPLVFEGRSVSWDQLGMRNFRRFDGW